MKNRLIAITGVITIVLSVVALTVGQEASVTQSRANLPLLKSAEPLLPSDPLSDVLITPEMIMRHAHELKLTPIQRAFIRKEVENSSVKFNELQSQLKKAVEDLHDVIKLESVNEERALGQLNKVLDTELEIKRLRMRMSIRIKNQLTFDQLEKLQSIRSSTSLFIRPNRNVHPLKPETRWQPYIVAPKTRPLLMASAIASLSA